MTASDLPDINDAKNLVYDFVRAWSDWETKMSRTPDSFKNPQLLELHAANLAQFCTKKKRAYVDCVPSYSSTLTYGDVSEATLVHSELATRTKAHLDFKGTLTMHRFIVAKKKDGWLLDRVQWKVIPTSPWKNGLIGV